MKQVIVFPRGQLDAKDKERLTKSGVIAVEADAPHLVIMLTPGTGMVSGDDLLMSALAGLDTDQTARATMVRELRMRLLKREATK